MHSKKRSARLESRLMTYAALPVMALAGAGNAKSAGITLFDFDGDYDPANWTFTTDGDGSVNTAGAPASIVLTGSNDAGGSSDTDYTIAATLTGFWSFDWNYSSSDSSFYDQGGWLLNGLFTQLAQNDSPVKSGSESIPIVAGDIIGYRVNSFDSILGPGVLGISSFAVSEEELSGVPEPSTLSLMALGVAGLLLARKRARKQA